MNGKVMTIGNLEDIVARLKGCRSLVDMLCQVAEVSSIPENALSGICDLLEMICRDFQADIDAAEEVQA